MIVKYELSISISIDLPSGSEFTNKELEKAINERLQILPTPARLLNARYLIINKIIDVLTVNATNVEPKGLLGVSEVRSVRWNDDKKCIEIDDIEKQLTYFVDLESKVIETRKLIENKK